jgi:hypothetical protein
VRSTMEPRPRAQIFLCHASQDKQSARELCERLLGEGFDVWLDERSLLPGQNWEQEIRVAVKNSDAIIVMISNNSVSKTGFVQREVSLALDAAEERPESAIFLIPFRLDDAPIPERLSKWQWLDSNGSDWFDRLLGSLNSLTPHTHLSENSILPPERPAADLIALDCNLETTTPGQTVVVEYRILSWSDQTVPVELGASLLSQSGIEYWDVDGGREVELVPGTAIYRLRFKIPLSTPSGTYRLVGDIWFPKFPERRLARIDRGFIMNLIKTV